MEATALGKKLFCSVFVQVLMVLNLSPGGNGGTDCGVDGLGLYLWCWVSCEGE